MDGGKRGRCQGLCHPVVVSIIPTALRSKSSGAQRKRKRIEKKTGHHDSPSYFATSPTVSAP